MKRVQVELAIGFDVVAGNNQAQVATLVLGVGESTGGPTNRHPDSDQWLYTLSGAGEATVAGNQVDLRPGVLLLIEKGQTHEIRNAGPDALELLSFYVPPVY